MIIGIDPGKAGGVAGLLRGGADFAVPTPILGGEVYARALLGLLDTIDEEVELVVIEKVSAMRGWGSSSSFKFGTGYGMLRGAIEGQGYPVRLVAPQTWQKRVLGGTAKSRTKDASIAFVQRAYPDIDLIPGKCRTPQDGLADAVCLAEWGRMEVGHG